MNVFLSLLLQYCTVRENMEEMYHKFTKTTAKPFLSKTTAIVHENIT
jgi:hypothetical protein